MKKRDFIKKAWIKPELNALSIKKDTFSGSGIGAERDLKGTAQVPKDPTPR